MLTTTRKQIIEKVILSKDGVPFRVWFEVSFINGCCDAKILRAIPIEETQKAASIIALPEARKITHFDIVKEFVSLKRIASPYASLLFVSGSKPRAPSKLI